MRMVRECDTRVWEGEWRRRKKEGRMGIKRGSRPTEQVFGLYGCM